MYPVHNVDAQCLLATLRASKRRPAALVDIVTAADLLGCAVVSANQWAEAFRRLATHGLVTGEEGAYALTAAGQTIGGGLPKKADVDEQVFLVRERLSAYTPAEKSPSIPVGAEHFDSAVREHAALARQAGPNLLMPKPKVEEDPRRAPRKPYAGGRRRN